ncbi:MAG: hypothetical protein LAO08_16435 [Acidobacteriia bacterium]|nr:hypothetical protein [Terriglobia bacterium]
MAKAKEFTVTIEDKPGALGKCLRALAERGVNILAFQSYVEEGESLARFLADNTPAAKEVLGNLRMIFEETEVAVIRLVNRPGELGRAASRIGEHQINIDYTYIGIEPGSSRVLAVFGVDNLNKAAALLDDLAAESA